MFQSGSKTSEAMPSKSSVTLKPLCSSSHCSRQSNIFTLTSGTLITLPFNPFALSRICHSWRVYEASAGVCPSGLLSVTSTDCFFGLPRGFGSFGSFAGSTRPAAARSAARLLAASAILALCSGESCVPGRRPPCFPFSPAAAAFRAVRILPDARRCLTHIVRKRSVFGHRLISY